MTSGSAITLTGSTNSILHRKGGQSQGGNSGEVGGNAPPGGGQQGGGGNSGGNNGSVGDDTGEELGSESGFNTPTSIGATTWTNPTNAYSSDGSYATAASTLSQLYGTFGFSVPSANTITGIEVKFEAKGSTAAGTVSIKLSWDGGTSLTSSKTTGTLTTSDVVYSLGGPSDLWGKSDWTATHFGNGNFTIELTSNTSGNTISVDAIQVRVYHQATGGGGGGGGGMVAIPGNQQYAGVYNAMVGMSPYGRMIFGVSLALFSIGIVLLYIRKRNEEL